MPNKHLAIKANARVKKLAEVDGKKLMYAGVYAANKVDTDDEMMVQYDLTNAAHEFLKKYDLSNSMDTNHDGKPNNCVPVESYINPVENQWFEEGEWVVVSDITKSPNIWKQLQTGELNGYSFEGFVEKVATEIDLEFYRDNVAVTAKTEDEDGEDHDHVTYFIKDTTTGKVSSGITDIVNGHYHTVDKGTATNEAIYLETTKQVKKAHRHRYNSQKCVLNDQKLEVVSKAVNLMTNITVTRVSIVKHGANETPAVELKED